MSIMLRTSATSDPSTPLAAISAKEPLEISAMDNLVPLSKTKSSKTFIFVMTEHNSKLKRTIRAKKTTATDVAKSFVEDWIIPYGISNRFFNDDGYQFVGKLFHAFWVALGTRLTTKTGYHPQPSGIHKKIIGRSRPYFSEHQKK